MPRRTSLNVRAHLVATDGILPEKCHDPLRILPKSSSGRTPSRAAIAPNCQNAGCEKLSTILGLRAQSTSRHAFRHPPHLGIDTHEFRLRQLGKKYSRGLPVSTESNMNLPANRDEAIAYLFARIDYERKIHVPYSERNFKLDRMRDLARRLGDPHHQLRIIHVAGTKGKGSTSTMLAAILRANGFSTGLFTSPHLQRLEERIVINDRPIPADRLTSIMRQLIPVLQAMEAEDPVEQRATFFEVVTAMALLHFAQESVDVVVLEVGLGGRLDSTNICEPQLCVITEIDLDHTRQLGDTLEKIAAEKAGIIKPGIPVVCSVTRPEPLAVIREKAASSNSELFAAGDRFASRYHPPESLPARAGEPAHASAVPVGEKLDFYFDGSSLLATHNAILNPLVELPDIRVSMMGEHQAANAATALAAANVLQSLGFELTESATRTGLLEAQCRARVELVATAPTVILDVGHNEASIRALTKTLERFPQEAFQRLVIVACTRGKAASAMLRLLLPWCAHLLVTKYATNPRGRDVTEMMALCERQRDQLLAENPDRPLAETSACDDPLAAWRRARELSTNDSLICVTGSFFLAAELETLARGGPTEASS